MNINTWIALYIGLVGIAGSLLAQALFWGIFKGTVQAQIAGIIKTIDLLQSEETLAKRELWQHVDDHGQRIFGMERVCKLNHYELNDHDNHARESHKS
jgi:hypothetical protein